jgi:raffinose synthase
MKNLTSLFCAVCIIAVIVLPAGAWAIDITLKNGTLSIDNRPVLENIPKSFSVVEDPTGTGVFLRFTAGNSSSFIQTPLGKIAGLSRFTSTHRYEPFWMKPAAGTSHADVQFETQWLLAETKGGDCVMLVPLIDGVFRFSISGGNAGLNLTGETGDPFTVGTGGVALFVSAGRDPYAMSEAGAKAVMKHLGTGKLRSEKPTPDFTDLFGWCTWNSFYQEVSADKVRAGLESFKTGGVEPRFLILDDGWQDYKQTPTGEQRLVSLAANQQRFGGDLTPTVKLAKQDFKIRVFIVWQTIYGYWGGVDGKSLSGYDVRDVPRLFGPGIMHQEPELNVKYWGPLVGLVSAEKIGKFMNDYHQRMKAQGVDGVKVDSQATIEGVATGQGGRIALTRAYREALEKSVTANFDGRLINCMSNGMETYYGSPQTTLIRTSTDFWPLRPETHGLHIYTNAQVGLWWGQFMQPDWDMFQSAHPMGSYHAAGRAVSGGPVYVSDTPDAHDFKLLKKLVLSDGSVLRADNVGRPTRDCLFADVMREPVLLKVFNYNRDCAVIGAFNANYHAKQSERVTIEGSVSPSDAPDLKGEEFVGFAHRANRLWRCKRADREPLKLAEGEWEIVSFAPINGGFAALGLADKLNSTGASKVIGLTAGLALMVHLRDGGEFIAWCEKAPRNVQSNGNEVEFKHDAASGRLSVILPAPGPQSIRIQL